MIEKALSRSGGADARTVAIIKGLKEGRAMLDARHVSCDYCPGDRRSRAEVVRYAAGGFIYRCEGCHRANRTVRTRPAVVPTRATSNDAEITRQRQRILAAERGEFVSSSATAPAASAPYFEDKSNYLVPKPYKTRY